MPSKIVKSNSKVLVDMSHLNKVVWFEKKVVRNSIGFCCLQKKSATHLYGSVLV